LDIGSTTIKCVVLNDAEQIVYSTYERHYSHILEKGKELLHRAAEHLRAHRDEFPEYDPENDIFNRCTTDGGFVQIR